MIEAIKPPDFYYSPLIKLVKIENIANRGGGSCWNSKELKKIRTVCNDHGLEYHLDGARIWNALVSKKETARNFGQLFDTMSVCLSKGLGCPIGSVLIGDDEIMQNSWRRYAPSRLFGGSGTLCPGPHHLDRLSEDHQEAKEIEQVLSRIKLIKKVEPVETNNIIFELADRNNESKFLKNLADKNLRFSNMGNGKLRIVNHLDYIDEMHDKFLSELQVLKL